MADDAAPSTFLQPGSLAGRTALVTGGGTGLGLEVATRLGRLGANITCASRDVTHHTELIERGREHGFDVESLALDVRESHQVRDVVRATVRRFGGLDILVNNAVMFHYAPLVDFDPQIASRMLDIGLKGTYWCFQAATPHLKARGRGSIINLSSIAVSMSIPNASVYTSIKGGIDALTRQQAAELGPLGIRVNALAPGSVPTPGANSVITADGWKSRAQKSVLRYLPSAEEIGDAAVFLASEEAASITGVTLKIDAGMTITGP